MSYAGQAEGYSKMGINRSFYNQNKVTTLGHCLILKFFDRKIIIVWLLPVAPSLKSNTTPI